MDTPVTEDHTKRVRARRLYAVSWVLLGLGVFVTFSGVGFVIVDMPPPVFAIGALGAALIFIGYVVRRLAQDLTSKYADSADHENA